MLGPHLYGMLYLDTGNLLINHDPVNIPLSLIDKCNHILKTDKSIRVHGLMMHECQNCQFMRGSGMQRGAHG